MTTIPFLVSTALMLVACLSFVSLPLPQPALAQTRKISKSTELREQIEQIAAEANGKVGVAVMLVETGAAVYFNGNDRFPMQSVYKLPIGIAILRQVDAGKIKLDQKVHLEKNEIYKTSRILTAEKYPNGAQLEVKELLRLMVSESDNTASDALLRLVGGPEAVMQALGGLDIKEIVVANSEQELGQDWQTQYRNYATPKAMVQLLSAVYERRGLSEQSQILLLKFMTESPTGTKRLKGLLSKDAVVAHKTGTSSTRNGVTAATNDVGLITLPNGQHLAAAVFVSDSSADEATREDVIAEIARATWDHYVRGSSTRLRP